MKEESMLMNDFEKTINKWIDIVKNNSFESLYKKPDAERWSVGQVCIHLLNDTNWFIEQINNCLLGDENSNKKMTATAKSFFINNSFPDVKLTNPNNANMPQPTSKEQLLGGFMMLKKNMNEATEKINEDAKGKTKHPGFGYFNATEWLQFAEMHMRHHLKQVTEFCKKNENKEFYV